MARSSLLRGTAFSRARIIITAGIAAAILLIGLSARAEADPQGAVSISVEAEAVGITISGGNVAFAGAAAPGAYLFAHPSLADAVTPPSVTNSGNVPIEYLDVTFDGPAGQEASCDGGESSWAAHASSVAQDRFVLEAIASSSGSSSIFNSAAGVAPSTGTGDILASTLLADDSIPLLLRLRMPDPVLAGGEGCSISLTVTAAAE